MSIPTLSIRLSTINDVKDFVHIVNQCPYDIDLISGRYIVDAKSIMGIFSLDLTKPRRVSALPLRRRDTDSICASS